MRIPFLFVLLLPFVLAGCMQWRPPPELTDQGPVRDFAKWERVRDAERADPSFTAAGIAGLDGKRNTEWLALCRKAPELNRYAVVKAVNLFFNQWKYIEDRSNWGMADHWATPREFVRKSGDCEDYAIAKYYALRFLGVAEDDLRIAAVWNKRRGEGHALLLVRDQGEFLLLDCLTDTLLDWEKAPQYLPRFSVNETFLWRLPVADSR